jgi:hypothetical protein
MRAQNKKRHPNNKRHSVRQKIFYTEDESLLGCSAMQSRWRRPTFQKCILPPLSWYWWWRQYTPPKRRYTPTKLQGSLSQKNLICVLSVVRPEISHCTLTAFQSLFMFLIPRVTWKMKASGLQRFAANMKLFQSARLLTVLTAVLHLHYMALRLWKWDPKALDLGIAATLTSRRQFWFESKDSEHCKEPRARPHFSVVYDVRRLYSRSVAGTLRQHVTCFWEHTTSTITNTQRWL